MNALIIAQNQNRSLKICVEALYQYGNIDTVSMIIIDEDCNVLDVTSSGECEPKVVAYMPPMNPQLSIQRIFEVLKSICEMLLQDVIIKILLPVAMQGEEPWYSFETIFQEIYRNGFVLQETKAVQYLYFGRQMVGYDLTVSLRKSKCILFLQSGNALIDYNVKQIAGAYRYLGWETVVGDLRTDSIADLLQTGISKAFVFNNMGWISAKTSAGDIMWDEYKIPSINYIFDHPMYYDEILRVAPKEGILVCVDNNHTKYINRFYPNIGACHFMPLAGDNDLDGIACDWDERTIDVLYVGGYKGNLDSSRFSDDEKSMLEAILQSMDCSTETAIERECRKARECSDEEIKEEIIRYNELDWYVMTHIRVEVIRALVRGGINVTVYGYGGKSLGILIILILYTKVEQHKRNVLNI